MDSRRLHLPPFPIGSFGIPNAPLGTFPFGIGTLFSPFMLPTPMMFPYHPAALLAFQQGIYKMSKSAQSPPPPPRVLPSSSVDSGISMFPFVTCNTPSSSASSSGDSNSSPEQALPSSTGVTPCSVKKERKTSSPRDPACKCHICGKTFSRQWLLQGHIRTHTGEKPFQCFTCKKSFADKSNLRAHMQTHSGIKPFHCGRCGKRFALKSYLSKHEESACLRGKPNGLHL